jgi:hypothetical protein
MALVASAEVGHWEALTVSGAYETTDEKAQRMKLTRLIFRQWKS